MGSNVSPSIVRLNIGGEKFCTTMDTLSRREPDSMLAVMFSGRHNLSLDSEEYVFIDRDGKHFRYILNWMRGCVVPTLSAIDYFELQQEADYYQLLGLTKEIRAAADDKKQNGVNGTDLTRSDIIKCIQSKRIKFRGDLSNVDFSYACLKNVIFSRANVSGANFEGANLQNANLQDACLSNCCFIRADLHSAQLQGSDLNRAHLEEANIEGANLEGARLTGSIFSGANLIGAKLERTKLRSANLYNANLSGANLRGADLRYVDLMQAILDGADLRGYTSRFVNLSEPRRIH